MSASYSKNRKIQYILNLIVLIAILLLSMMVYLNFYSVQPELTLNQNNINNKIEIKSCLNDIFDAIFVISIKTRTETLNITLFQLYSENIKFILWEGHSINNSYSLFLHKTLKQYIDKKNVNPYIYGVRVKGAKINSAYYNANVFFLRQTQIDIIKYSKANKLNKILIFEDGILLSNPYYIDMFCLIEPNIKRWYILNLGVNGYSKEMKLLNVSNYENKEIKIYHKQRDSWGAFAIAFHKDVYKYFIRAFDFDINSFDNVAVSHIYPLDMYFVVLGHRVWAQYQCYNIHPTLVLPDMTSSVIRKLKKNEATAVEWIQERTTDGNISHFSKYWKLRFSNDTQIYTKQIHDVVPTFDKLLISSPSNLYLENKSQILYKRTR